MRANQPGGVASRRPRAAGPSIAPIASYPASCSSRTVSTAVVEVVQAALAAHPAWVVAKGGITSHDVAVRGLGIRRAEVIGQLFPGMVSVFRPIEAAPEAVGTPYVVFAGNVGDDDTLADVVDLFTGRN